MGGTPRSRANPSCSDRTLRCTRTASDEVDHGFLRLLLQQLSCPRHRTRRRSPGSPVQGIAVVVRLSEEKAVDHQPLQLPGHAHLRHEPRAVGELGPQHLQRGPPTACRWSGEVHPGLEHQRLGNRAAEQLLELLHEGRRRNHQAQLKAVRSPQDVGRMAGHEHRGPTGNGRGLGTTTHAAHHPTVQRQVDVEMSRIGGSEPRLGTERDETDRRRVKPQRVQTEARASPTPRGSTRFGRYASAITASASCGSSVRTVPRPFRRWLAIWNPLSERSSYHHGIPATPQGVACAFRTTATSVMSRPGWSPAERLAVGPGQQLQRQVGTAAGRLGPSPPARPQSPGSDSRVAQAVPRGPYRAAPPPPVGPSPPPTSARGPRSSVCRERPFITGVPLAAQ